jgi:hypothetical protein
LLRRSISHQSSLGGFINENSSSIVDCNTIGIVDAGDVDALHTALISSRKSVRKRSGSGELLATRARRSHPSRISAYLTAI